MAQEQTSNDTALALSTFLDTHPKVEYLHLRVTDLFGVPRSRVIPKQQGLKFASKGSGKRISALTLLGHASAWLLPEAFLTGPQLADIWEPDWSTATILDSRNASVLCCVSREADHRLPPTINSNSMVDPRRRCPRHALSRTLQQAREQSGLDFHVGFELEFYLLAEPHYLALLQLEATNHSAPAKLEGQHLLQPIAGAPSSNYFSAGTFNRGPIWECLLACADALAAAQIGIEQLHTEMAPHQYEISLCPLPALKAVDVAIQAMEVIKRTAADSAMVAVFHCAPFPGFEPSGMHVHLSIDNHETDANSSGVPSTSRSEHFLAGIMRRLTPLCALGSSVPEFYAARLEHNKFGRMVAWGSDNRATPVRVVSYEHWEFRAVDVSANLYMVVAAYVAAGLLGLRNREKLQLHDCLADPSRMTEQQLKSLGIVDPIAPTLDFAFRSLDDDGHCLGSIIGLEMLQYCCAVRQCDPAMAANDRRRYLLLMY